MERYLKKFSHHNEYEDFIENAGYYLPYVSVCVDLNDCHYDYKELPYLTFTALQDGSTVTLAKNYPNVTTLTASFQYSTDGGYTWDEYVVGSTLTLQNKGDNVKFKGVNSGLVYRNQGNYDMILHYYKFTLSGRIMGSGDITSLLNGIGGDCQIHPYEFISMFSGCTALETAPSLPSKNLQNYCYKDMFRGCTSLTTAPELPSTALASGCYYGMFSGCTSLMTAPELPSTKLEGMCYYGMFAGCTSLTTAPELNAEDLISQCYSNMFSGCSSLNYIKAMFVTNPTTSYTQNWVAGVASTGTYIKNGFATYTTVDNYGIPNGWVVNVTDASLAFVAEENGSTIRLVRVGTDTATLPNASLEYSLDNGSTWSHYTYSQNDTNGYSGLVITLSNAGDSVKLRGGNGRLFANESNYHKFVMTGKIMAKGRLCDINSYGIENYNFSSVPATSAYTYLFSGCTALTKAPEIGTVRAASFCFYGMFAGCASLKSVPHFSVKNSTYASHYRMFEGCTSLENCPMNSMDVLNESIGYSGCSYMFAGCTSMKDAPCHIAEGSSCACMYMFSGCTSLKTGPFYISERSTGVQFETSTYEGMFKGCTSLENGPSIFTTNSATTFSANSTSYNICANMFEGCTSLKTPPSFPSAGMWFQSGGTDGFFYAMFSGCTSLESTPQILIATDSVAAVSAFTYMFAGCTSLKTAEVSLNFKQISGCSLSYMFYQCESLENTPSSIGVAGVGISYSACSYMFAGCKSIVTAPELVSTSLWPCAYYAMFSGCTSLTGATLPKFVYRDSQSLNYMFDGCSSLNYIKYMSTMGPSMPYNKNWVRGVSSTGTFVKNSSASYSLSRGVYAIPYGWTIVNE